MTTILLFVIIAILLFGSSVFLGVIGMIAGFIALVFALTLGMSKLADLFGMPTDDMVIPACCAVVTISVLAMIAQALMKLRAEAKKQRR